MPLDLELDQDEQAVLNDLDRLFDREGGLALARQAEADGTGISRQLWEKLAASGFVGLALPEQVGGGGAPVSLTMQASRAAGRFIAPAPLEAAGFLAPGLVQFDRDLCAAMTGGHLLATVRLASLATRSSGQDRQIVVRNGRVSGPTGPGPYGGVADVVVLRTGRDVVVVDIRESGIATAIPDMAARGLAEIELAGAPVMATAPEPDGASLAITRILLAARAVGGAEACLAMAVEYARQRQQFGRPIGAFQAIQHSLADASIAVSAAVLLVHRAAASPDSEGAVLGAWLAGTRAFVEVSRVAVHVFGGYGFTLEYDPQLFYRSAKALETAFGPVRGIGHDEARKLAAGFGHHGL
jgi:alkylation response protein AidB-like acyl-CoA dehydrogenase